MTTPVFDRSDLDELSPSAREAIERALERTWRSSAADDVEATIGAAKELVETVAKVSINALGGSYGSNADIPTLANEVLTALGLHPGGLQGRDSLRRLSQSLISTVNAIAELRNSDGTGHGRAVPSSLHMSHATLAMETSLAWSHWVLSLTARAVRKNLPIDQVVSDLAGPLTLSRGKLPRLLKDLGLDDLGEEAQHKLGLAVARRWSVNGTFLPREDVIEPMAAGRATYPPAFAAGVIEGLLLDYDGYLRVRPNDLELVASIGERLPPDEMVRTFRQLATRVEDALASYAFDDEAQEEASSQLEELVKSAHPAIRESLARVRSRLLQLRVFPEEAWDDEETADPISGT